jgi:hypothetical protein
VIRRGVAAAAIVLGIALVVAPIATSLFSRSKSAQDLADGVRPAMTRQALAADRQGFQLIDGAITEFNGTARARFAHVLGDTPQQFSAYLDQTFPDVASGARELPRGYVPHADAVLTALERNRARYETADSFPVKDVSARVAPWIFIALGAGLIVIGLAMLRTRGRIAPVALLLLGLGPLVFTLAASLPHKASASSELVHALRPAFSRESTGRVPAEIATAQKFDVQLESGLVPALEKRHMVMSRDAPALARALPQFKPILTNFAGLGTALRDDRHFFVDTSKIPIRTLVWLMLAICGVIIVGAVLALVAPSRPARQLPDHTEAPA